MACTSNVSCYKSCVTQIESRNITQLPQRLVYAAAPVRPATRAKDAKGKEPQADAEISQKSMDMVAGQMLNCNPVNMQQSATLVSDDTILMVDLHWCLGDMLCTALNCIYRILFLSQLASSPWFHPDNKMFS